MKINQGDIGGFIERRMNKYVLLTFDLGGLIIFFYEHISTTYYMNST